MPTIYFYMFADQLPNVGDEAKGQQKGYHTGVAGEFYVLSCLHRLQINSYLTLGNQKAIDIIVWKEDGDVKTIDVKAIDKNPFVIGLNTLKSKSNHYYVCVFFGHDKKSKSYSNIKIPPRLFVVPSGDFVRIAQNCKKGVSSTVSFSSEAIEKYEDFDGTLLQKVLG